MTILPKQALKVLFLLSCSLFTFIPNLYANSLNQSGKELSPEVFEAFHQCNKTFEYAIYVLGNKVGTLERTIKWNKKVAAKAIVTSYGEVSFLWLDSIYRQTSTMQYSTMHKHFLTPGFSQNIIGFKAREMTAKMSNDGLSSTVTLDNEVYHYPSHDKSEEQGKNSKHPLYDIDTLGAQIRLNLLQGKTHFSLFRQASKKIDKYQFEVVGKEIIDHKKWGQLTTIKVIEVGEHNNTVLWFSSKHDHQLVKAQLDLIFSPTAWLTSFTKQCEQ